jgi:hypothetical protein
MHLVSSCTLFCHAFSFIMQTVAPCILFNLVFSFLDTFGFIMHFVPNHHALGKIMHLVPSCTRDASFASLKHKPRHSCRLTAIHCFTYNHRKPDERGNVCAACIWPEWKESVCPFSLIGPPICGPPPPHPPSHPYPLSIQASCSPERFGIIGPFFKGPTGQSRNRLKFVLLDRPWGDFVAFASITIKIGSKTSGTINVSYILYYQ